MSNSMTIAAGAHSPAVQGNVINNVSGNLTKIEHHYGSDAPQPQPPPSIFGWEAKPQKLVDAEQMGGEWLLKHEAYLAWKADKPRLLWLVGVPGAGKTVLCSRVKNDIQNSPAVLEFYCDRQSNHPSGIYSSLLDQLLRKLPSDSPGRNNSTPGLSSQIITDNNSVETFVKIITDISQELDKMFVIIDGLYECASFEAILQGLMSLASHSHVFVSSRDHPKIREVFESCEKIIISERHIAKDVERFVKTAMQWLGVDSREIKESLSDTRGTFFWPVFHIQQIQETCQGSHNERRIQNTLKGVPQRMESFFLEALQSINSWQRCHRLALLLVVFAERPITVDALAHGVATYEHDIDKAATWDPKFVTTSPRSLVDGCKHLLTCVPASHRIHYRQYWPKDELVITEDWKSIFGDGEIVVPFHPSLRDLLLADRTLLPASLIRHSPHSPNTALSAQPSRAPKSENDKAETPHDQLAYLCSAHLDLLRKSIAQRGMQHSGYPFAKYAFLELRSRVRDPAAIHRTQNQKAPASLAWLAVKLEIIPWLDESDLTTGDDGGLKALHMAAKYSASLPTIDHLLSKDVNQVKQASKDCYSATPLHFAVMYHRQPVEVIKRLLKAGADVNAKATRDVTALHILMIMKWWDPEVAKSCMDLLLEHGADVTAQDSDLQTPFHVLAQHTQHYCPKLAESLLRKKVDVNARDIKKRTPLHWAAEAGCLSLVALLLESEADVNVVDQHGNTPLLLAQKAVDATNVSQHALIAQLLHHYADANANGNRRIWSAAPKIFKIVAWALAIGALVIVVLRIDTPGKLGWLGPWVAQKDLPQKDLPQPDIHSSHPPILPPATAAVLPASLATPTVSERQIELIDQ